MRPDSVGAALTSVTHYRSLSSGSFPGQNPPSIVEPGGNSSTFARMIFCSLVIVSSNRRGGALRHPDRSAPRLGRHRATQAW